MRIIGTLVLGLAAGLLAVQLPGCATSDRTRTAGQALDDASITARVKTALAKDEGIGKAMDINVTTNQGVVQLSGFVESQDLISRAGELARNVQGVRSVRNDLHLAQSGRGSSAGAGAGAPANPPRSGSGSGY